MPLLGALVLPALLAPPALAAKNDTLLISRAPGVNGAGGDGTSSSASVSGDGQLVAFTSEAENLLPDDTDFWPDVFVRDTVKNTLRVVDRATGANGVRANAPAFAEDISANGRYVVFFSIASNLDPAVSDPDNDPAHVYVRDLKTNRTRLVSRAAGVNGAPGNDSSDEASISADGRYVAFMSYASNLAPDDTDVIPDLFVRDTQSNTTTLVTRSAPGVAKTVARLEAPEISGTGRFIGFATGRHDLVPSGTGSRLYVVVTDRQSGTSEVVSRASGPGGALPDGDASPSLAMSADGRFVAFDSDARNLAPGADDPFTDVFVRDRQAATTTLVTANANVGQTEESGGHSNVNAISADGRYVVINSAAPGLFPNGQNPEGGGQIFVRDMKTKTTTTASRASGAAGALGNDFSEDADISGDGRIVAFASAATNLHPDAVAAGNADDETGGQDVFARDVLGPQSTGATKTNECPLSGHVVTGTANADDRLGTSATDIMYGAAGNDTLRGFDGADCIYGQSGRDRLLGQGGGDRLFGGSAADHLSGGRGNDRLEGQGGPDRLKGGLGGDRLLGGPGADRLIDRSGRDRFSGGAGNDRIYSRDRRRRDRRRADRVRCGSGRHDVARVDAADRVAHDCERIVRR